MFQKFLVLTSGHNTECSSQRRSIGPRPRPAPCSDFLFRGAWSKSRSECNFNHAPLLSFPFSIPLHKRRFHHSSVKQSPRPLIRIPIKKTDTMGRPSETEDSESQPAERVRRDYNDTISVLAGPEEERFTLHTATACETPLFLKAACSHHWTEGKERLVRIPEHSAWRSKCLSIGCTRGNSIRRLWTMRRMIPRIT